MNRYSVLLVDDEEFVFEVMMKKMNWEEMGFRIAGYAKNGVEALEMAEEIQPDVVMTDIKMPYMDGLTLCRKLKEQLPNIKTIILSGFDDFDYAKEAIRLETLEYILKPIDAKELRDVFQRVKNGLDEEIKERRNMDSLQDYYLKSLPLLQDNFYITLLEGRIAQEQIGEYASDYQVNLQGPYYSVSVIHISHKEKTCEEMNLAPYMLSISVQQLVKEQLKDKWNTKVLSYLDDLILISQFDCHKCINDYTDYMDRLCKYVKKMLNVVITVGIGSIVDGPEDIRNSYRDATNAVSYRALYGNEKAINIQEVDLNGKKNNQQWDGKETHDIVKYMKLGERTKLESKIDQFFQQISGEEKSIQSYKLHLMKLMVEMIEFMDECEINARDIFDDIDNFPENILKIQAKEDTKAVFLEKCNRILDTVAVKRHDTRHTFVSKAQDYVEEHYGEQDLGIDTICQYLNVSSSYFSTAFKKSTGKTFINYLTDYRMEQAIQMLQISEYKTYEIAEKVGYSDPNYFSYVFKKQLGVSPSKYRRQVLK